MKDYLDDSALARSKRAAFFLGVIQPIEPEATVDVVLERGRFWQEAYIADLLMTPGFTILSMQCGDIEVIAEGAEVPSEAFKLGYAHPPISAIVPYGEPIRMKVRNDHKSASQTFRALATLHERTSR